MSSSQEPQNIRQVITKDIVTNHIEERIAESDIFIVDVTVRPGNVIEVTLDADGGISIESCTEVHRHLLKQMDREVEDYSLVVGSPDLTKPLLVRRQYVKNIGRSLAVKTREGNKFEGVLTHVTDTDITLHTRNKEDVPGKKSKQWVERDKLIAFDQIDIAKIVIQFK
jgi:ribosome maturation factor RimP